MMTEFWSVFVSVYYETKTVLGQAFELKFIIASNQDCYTYYLNSRVLRMSNVVGLIEDKYNANNVSIVDIPCHVFSKTG